MRGSYAIVLSVLVAGCAQVQSAHPRSEPVNVKTTTLRLDFENDGFCSGTAVGKQVVLTASHCLKRGALLTVNGKPVKVTAREDDGKDHSLLWVNVTFTHVAKMGGTLQQGDSIEYWGNPMGITDQYRRGYVTGFIPENDAILFDSNGWFGDSGAGIFKDGKVVTTITGMFSSEIFYIMRAYPLSFSKEQLSKIK